MNKRFLLVTVLVVTMVVSGCGIQDMPLNTEEHGVIVVNADKTEKTQIVFNGVSVNSQTCAAIYVVQADKVFLTLASGSENTLSNGGTFTVIDENNVDAVIFSKEDLTINGSGSLKITSPAAMLQYAAPHRAIRLCLIMISVLPSLAAHSLEPVLI